jgi:hypothetical protein
MFRIPSQGDHGGRMERDESGFLDRNRGILFLLPLAQNRPFQQGLLISLRPTIVQLFVIFPYELNKGMLGIELGTLTPVFVLFFNAVLFFSEKCIGSNDIDRRYADICCRVCYEVREVSPTNSGANVYKTVIFQKFLASHFLDNYSDQ